MSTTEQTNVPEDATGECGARGGHLLERVRVFGITYIAEVLEDLESVKGVHASLQDVNQGQRTTVDTSVGRLTELLVLRAGF